MVRLVRLTYVMQAVSFVMIVATLYIGYRDFHASVMAVCCITQCLTFLWNAKIRNRLIAMRQP